MAVAGAKGRCCYWGKRMDEETAASLLASFPELANVPTDQLQTAVNAIAQVSPQRAAAIPRGILFILDTPQYSEHRLESLRFEKTVNDLHSEGRCVLPKNRWVQ